MMTNFNKRIFTPERLAEMLTGLAQELPRIWEFLQWKNVDRRLFEELFLVVTSVNQCRYCAWVHTDGAASAGLGRDQINALLHGDVEAAHENVPALSYALHYAWTDQKPDPKETRKLYEEYGEAKARDILLALKIIFFANFSGNTGDAFLSRLKGNPAKDSSALFEAIFFALSALPLGSIAAFTSEGENPLIGV